MTLAPVPLSFRPKALAVFAGVTMAAVLAGGLVPVAAIAAPTPAVLSAAPAATPFADQVNPFTTTEDDFGQDLPGALAPNSIVKINPMTTPGRSHSGYDYAETKIAGFTHTNIDGVGGSGAGGDVLVVPTYTSYTSRPTTDSYAKSYSHSAEEATPGYYSVDLATTSGPIVAEAAADVRTGQDRFTFPAAGTASLVVDLRNNFTSRTGSTLDVTKLSDGRTALAGDVSGFFNGYNYKLYYYVESTTATSAVRTWGTSGTLGTAAHQDGADTGAILDFPVAANGEVGLKVAISPISAAQAKIDLGAEMGDRSFNDVRVDTAAAWNTLLGRMDVTSSATSDPDGSLKELFYTHLYRMFGSPVNATSTSGTYRGADGVVREAVGYTHYDGWSLWDDFRKYETLAVGYPDIYRDEVQSLVDLFVAYGASGKNSLGSLTHSVPTVRFERAAVVIADAISKGATLTGLSQAYPALVSASTGGYSNSDNVARGYVTDRVDDTLGTAYDDWAMSTIATSLGKTADAQKYRLRATNWTNLFKKDAVTLADGSKSGLIFPRNAAGEFSSANPEQFESGSIYQGTLWQYNWYAADDMGGMIDLLGGKDKALSALSFMFGEQAPNDGSRMLHSNANEIDLQAPYLFNYVGAPSKTQYWVRNIYTKETWNRYIATGSTGELPSGGGELNPPIKTRVFTPTPQGFLPTMDNDAGTMSSTYVAAALGLFPVLAGANEYQIGTPFFENVRITYPTGRHLDISADGVSPDDFYVQSASLNGDSFDQSWISYDQLTAGGELSFDMGDTASDWAADGVSASSLSDDVSSTVYDRTATVAVWKREFSESRTANGAIDGSIGLSLTEGSFAGADGADLAATGAITASNVPAGLTLTARRTGAQQVDLALTGKAVASGALDSVDDLVISIGNAAYATKPTGGVRTFTMKVTFTGAEIEAGASTLIASTTGELDDSTSLTLHGATFAGAVGRDLVADGGLTVHGLPDGVTAHAVKVNDTTLTLRLEGTLAVASAQFSLEFADSALVGGKASALTGDGVSGLSTLTVEIDPAWRAQLQEFYSEARVVKKGNYSPATFSTFSAARTAAAAALANPVASDDDLQAAFTSLRSAAKQLDIKATAYRVLQAESFDSWSAGELKTEGGSDLSGAGLTDVGGVRPNSWLAYADLDFAGKLPKGVAIRYVNNSGRSAANSAVEVRLDAPDGALVSTIALPSIGNSWNHYTTVNYEFPSSAALTGSHTIYFVFRGTATDTNPWIVNLDWVQFLDAMPVAEVPTAPAVSSVRIDSDAYTSDNGGGLKKETGTDAAGVALTDIGGTWSGGVVTFETVDLGANPLSQFTVRYVNNSTRVGPNAKILVHLDTLDDTPLVTVPLPATGTNWNAYSTTTVTLPTPVSGSHQLLIEMKADTTSALPYVSNFDWFEFGPAAVVVPPVAASALHVEAESFTSNSGNGLKTEASTDAKGVALTDLGGTYDNAEARYAINLSGKSATTATIRYVHNTGRCGTNARADLWLDTREGVPFASIPLPTTGGNWNAYATATAALPRSVSGAHTLIVALRATTSSALPYVANVDWFELGYGVDTTGLRAAVADAAPYVAQAARYNAIDYPVFARVLDEAKQVVDAPTSTDAAVAEAQRRLVLATAQLQWKAVPQLAYLIDDAQALTAASYTDASFAKVTAALAAATAVSENAEYDVFADAVDALSSAMAELVAETAPVITLTTTQLSFVEGAAPSAVALVAALGATIDKGTLSIDSSKVAFGTAGTYTATLTGVFKGLAATPVTATITITAPAVIPPVVTPPVVTPPTATPTAATVTLTVKDAAYGKSASVAIVVTAGAAPASGTVTVTVSGKSYTATLVNGRATIALASTLKVGTLPVSVSYSGDSATAAATATDTVVIAKATTKVSVTPKASKPKVGKKHVVTVRVTGVSNPTGSVTISVGGKKIKTVTLKGSNKGSVKVTLPAIAKAGRTTITAKYAGSSTAKASTGSAKVTAAK